MKINKSKTIQIIFLISFFVLNITNTYFLTTHSLNRYISPFKHTFLGELNAFIGNFSMLLLAFILINLIFKKNKNKLIGMTYFTLFLNILIFILGFFTLFYGTAFSSNALDIFKNPAGGIAHGMFGVIISEVFLYFRIVVFLPFTVLLILLIQYNKLLKKDEEYPLLIDFNIKHHLTFVLAFFFFITLSFVTFKKDFKQSILPVGSAISSRATQNFGVYPFYAGSLLGLNFDITTRSSLDLEDDRELMEAYNEFNKNKDTYTNIIDGKTYSNITTYKPSSNLEVKDLNEGDSLNGIFKDKNVILIHLESINSFLFELEETKARMPFIQSLLEESYYFENYFTNVGMGVSADAEFSVLSGLYPDGYSTIYWSEKDYQFDTIPKLLNNEGYKSIATHNDFDNFYNREKAYPNLIGFNEPYYSLEDYAEENNMTPKEYVKHLKSVGFEGHKSPWPSDLQLSDFTYNKSKAYDQQKHMIFDITMMPHTPFEFNPYVDRDRPEYDRWDKQLKGLTRKYIDYVDYVDDVIKRLFIDPLDESSRIIDDNVYIFYGDHGSSLKNGDLSILYNKEMSAMEERLKLQQVAAFIYAPSSTVKNVNGYNINEGIIKGKQPLVRGHIDLYRTIIDLMGLNDKLDLYFGVNGLSVEPTYVIDNRVQDLVLQNTNNNKPYIVSLRNTNHVYPKNQIIEYSLINKIKNFKQLSDLIVVDDKVYKDLKKTLQNE